MYLSDDDIHLKFLLGLPVHIEGIGDFYSPLLTDVVNATESIYNQAVSSILLTKDQIKNVEGIEEFSNLDIVSTYVIHDISFREMFFYGLQIHLHKTPSIHKDGFFYFGELANYSILTDEKFEFIRRLIKIANNIEDAEKEVEEEFIPGNEQARQFMEELKKNQELLAKAKKKDKQPINLHSLISSVGWKAKSFNFINQLNIYQLYNGYFRLSTIDNYHYTMTGLYSGTIDSKSVKLPDINWANIIKTK